MGVAREEEAGGPCLSPNRRLSWLFCKKTGFVGRMACGLSYMYWLNMTKMRWRPGLRPGPRWGSSRRSPDHLIGWGRGTILPNSHSLGALHVLPLSVFTSRTINPCSAREPAAKVYQRFGPRLNLRNSLAHFVHPLILHGSIWPNFGYAALEITTQIFRIFLHKCFKGR